MITAQMEQVNKEKILEKVNNMSKDELQVIADAMPLSILHTALGKKIEEQTDFITRMTKVFNEGKV